MADARGAEEVDPVRSVSGDDLAEAAFGPQDPGGRSPWIGELGEGFLPLRVPAVGAEQWGFRGFVQ